MAFGAINVSEKGTEYTIDSTPTQNSTNPVASGGVKTALDGKLDKAGGTMSGAINMGSSKITNLGSPTDDADAATKKYVDDISMITQIVSVGVTAPEDTRLLWIDTSGSTGGLKYHDGSAWAHVPVSYN